MWAVPPSPAARYAPSPPPSNSLLLLPDPVHRAAREEVYRTRGIHWNGARDKAAGNEGSGDVGGYHGQGGGD
jgi:hypothetical protein